MEMTFPHFAQRQDSDTRSGYKAMLAIVIARQAASRTVRAVRRAELLCEPTGDSAQQRINYFALAGRVKVAVSGAFWPYSGTNHKSESGVYHAGSSNIKVHELMHAATGEQFNRAGHGARKI